MTEVIISLYAALNATFSWNLNLNYIPEILTFIYIYIYIIYIYNIYIYN